MTLQVELVNPEGELWTGEAQLVIARTLDGEIGVLTGHAPIIGILAEGSLVQIRPNDPAGPDVFAAVAGGFLSVNDNRVSILARYGQMGTEVDPAAARVALDEAIQAAGPLAGSPEEPAELRYARALMAAVAGQAS
ncbi:MAG: F0F1 ATP synthase subunit epsilon [Streptosporangiaceae bacterium]